MHYRLYSFLLQRAEADVYPEPPFPIHSQITEQMAPPFVATLPSNAQILDIGCGQGGALQLFATLGCRAVGIGIGETDLDACRAKNLEVFKMDQNELSFPENYFDGVWARHVLEHSLAPLFTLTEIARVLRPNGRLYAEMPAPNTSSCHELNGNHYSVFGSEAWAQLLFKAGFGDIKMASIPLKLDDGGDDEYYSFTATKL